MQNTVKCPINKANWIKNLNVLLCIGYNVFLLLHMQSYLEFSLDPDTLYSCFEIKDGSHKNKNNVCINFVSFMFCSKMGTRVFIGRLSYHAREKDVERFFRGYGRIRDVMLKNGYGFVVRIFAYIFYFHYFLLNKPSQYHLQ